MPTPRSRTTPSSPWAWWAVVSRVNVAWNIEPIQTLSRCPLLIALHCSRHKQRPSGRHAEAAGPVPRQRPQQPLHGQTGSGARRHEGRKKGLKTWCAADINPLLLCFQGLTHLGKGTLTLCPYHSDRQLMSQVAVAGLLTVLVSFLDVKNSEALFPLPAPSLFHF